MKIGVVDYQAGNLKSVETALRFLETDFVITGDPEILLKTDKLIFPGVGEAGAAMGVLVSTGLDQCIKEYLAAGKPVLGICLGSQIVLQVSEESEVPCLGIVRGMARMFPRNSGLKIPHMGWNQVTIMRENTVFKNIPDNTSFYFVHSYYPAPNEQTLLATTNYGIRFISAFMQENLVALQFHPEKSGKYGLQLLENFIRNFL